MMIRNSLLINIIFVFLFSTSCEEPENGIYQGEDNPEKVLYNANIYTVDPTNPWAEAIYITNGEIVFVGPSDEALEMASEEAERIDLNGKMVMPGIHDIHMHPIEASTENFHFIVDENELDPENYAIDVENASYNNSGTDWLLGWGFYLHTVLEGEKPPIEILDEVAPNRPVAIMEFTSHSIWANSKALELAGITPDSEDPEGGVIMKDEAGNPNGILIDNAGNLLIDLALQPSPTREANDYDGLVEFALPELAKNGITSVCDARTYWKRNHHLTWQKAHDNGVLTVRANLGLWAYPNDEDASQIATIQSMYSFDENSLLKVNQIKLYSDGIVHNTTAAMHDDYHFDLFHQPTNNGLNYFSETRIANYISQLEPYGFDFHIHAIGNRGIQESLNAIQQSGTESGRHRITHVEIVSPEDIPRFKQLNVIADCQVAGDFTNPSNWAENGEFVGSENSMNIIPLKDLNEAEAHLCLSSDWDVSSLNPFVGMQNAITRAPQNLSLAETIKAYTINPAFAMRQENLVGSLEIGKEADLIVLNQNLFEINSSQIAQTKVDRTYLQGRLIYLR